MAKKAVVSHNPAGDAIVMDLHEAGEAAAENFKVQFDIYHLTFRLEKSSPRSRLEKHPQTITDGECFTVGMYILED